MVLNVFILGLGTGETDLTTTDDDNGMSEGMYCVALFPGSSHLCSDVLNHF